MAFARFTRVDTDNGIVYRQVDTGTVRLASGARDFIVANNLGTAIRYDVEAGSFGATNQYLDDGEFRIHTTNVTGDVDIDIFPAHETTTLIRENASDPIEVRTVLLGNV